MNEQELLITEREVLEEMGPQTLAKFILRHSAIIAESERAIGIANDVLTGYGTSVDLELEKLNETDITGT